MPFCGSRRIQGVRREEGRGIGNLTAVVGTLANVVAQSGTTSSATLTASIETHDREIAELRDLQKRLSASVDRTIVRDK